MAWSDFGMMDLVRKQAGVKIIIRSSCGKTQQATTSFPLSDSVVFFHRWPGSRCAKPGWIRFLVRFWPNGSGPEASWPATGQHFWADPDQMWIRSGIFTEKAQTHTQTCHNTDLAIMFTGKAHTHATHWSGYLFCWDCVHTHTDTHMPYTDLAVLFTGKACTHLYTPHTDLNILQSAKLGW